MRTRLMHSSRLGALRGPAALLALVLAAATSHAPARADDSNTDRFPEVGRVSLPNTLSRQNSGWLVLDPPNRRGYTFTETTVPGVVSGSTIIQSFDLDTLLPLKQTTVTGLAVVAGEGNRGTGDSTMAGDIVHAVDSAAKRLYIPMQNFGLAGQAQHVQSQDSHRPTSYILVLDEAAFDSDPARAFGAFSFVGADQRLEDYGLRGMAVQPDYDHPNAPGSLQAVFASPNPLSSSLGVSTSVFYDHTLIQWSPGGLATHAAAPGGLSVPPPLPSDWTQVLTACATAPFTSAGGEGAESGTQKNFQWDFLPRRDAVYVGCQSAPGSGAVVRVALGANGAPAPGAVQKVVPLGKPIGDVLADRDGGRLYLRSFGGGATWWAFDVQDMRFAGSIAAHLTEAKPMAAGVDPGTGRLYTLTPDTCVPRQGGGELAFRGGLKMSEARLDPVPAPENLRPDLAYNSWWRINVDPVTRRVYVRRGIYVEGFQLAYPECDLRKRVDAPQELFYRVFEDRSPLAVPPADLDDSAFTTNVKEDPRLTQASYLGSGSGYGARVVLTGGLDAATNGLVTSAGSLCGREDRELLVGAVDTVEVSDQSVRAAAASLDADARTQEALGRPVNRCKPQAASGSGANSCNQAAETEELAFDERDPNNADTNGDGCVDRTGVNTYATDCIGDESPPEATGPPGAAAPRDGFRAKTVCDEKGERAGASADGAVRSTLDEAFRKERSSQGLPADAVRVGHSSSSVTISRKVGHGVVVAVTSTAKGVELPGLGSIGLVEVKATSTSTGRDGGARGTWKRKVCDIDFAGVVVPGCVSEEQLGALTGRLNDALSGRAEIRVRTPDPRLMEGTPHGYLAAVQRDRRQLFGDQTIARDRSLAVAGLEVMLYRGEGGPWGAGRQIIQLAGAQAATSYGIVCTYGQSPSGGCAKDQASLDDFDATGALATVEAMDSDDFRSEPPDDPAPVVITKGGDRDPSFIRLIKRIPEAIAQALRLLFNNPRELGLMAAVWALLYAPCYLGERRRRLGGLQGRRAAVGGVR